VLFPKLFREWGHGHHNLAWGLSGKPRQFDRDRGLGPGLDVARALALLPRTSAHTLVLSSEILIDVAPDRLAQLRDLVSPEHVDVVVYLRRRSAYLHSLWQERCKREPIAGFETYLLRQLQYSHSPNSRLSYKAQLDRLADVFGAAAIQVVNYDTARHEGRDIAELFVEDIVGVPLRATGPESNAANESLSPESAELLRLLQTDDAGATYDRAGALYRSFERAQGSREFERARRTLHELRDPSPVGIGFVDRLFTGEDREIVENYRIVNSSDQPDLFDPEPGPGRRVQLFQPIGPEGAPQLAKAIEQLRRALR
jgi:hypothetical protein